MNFLDLPNLLTPTTTITLTETTTSVETTKKTTHEVKEKFTGRKNSACM